MTKAASAHSGSRGLTLDLLEAMTEAYNRHDVEAIMSYFAADARFDHGAGSEAYGKRFQGLAEIRMAFEGLFRSIESVHWKPLDTRIAGDKAYCEFHRVARLKNGTVQDFLSVDVLTFRDGLIVHKDTYFKHRTS